MASSSDAITIPRRTLQRAAFGVVGVIVVAVIVGLGITVIRDRASPSDSLASAIDSSSYQAVFLTNTEIYFGRLTAPGGEFYYLRHVYRLTVQPAKQKGQPIQRTLVRITSDVHGPQDEMVINRRQILYVENLSPNSKAVALMNQGAP
jgi:hypothetical protein